MPTSNTLLLLLRSVVLMAQRYMGKGLAIRIPKGITLHISRPRTCLSAPISCLQSVRQTHLLTHYKPSNCKTQDLMAFDGPIAADDNERRLASTMKPAQLVIGLLGLAATALSAPTNPPTRHDLPTKDSFDYRFAVIMNDGKILKTQSASPVHHCHSIGDEGRTPVTILYDDTRVTPVREFETCVLLHWQ